ncbi:hypothetical protein N5E97_27530, partial [Escherichia coli]
VLNLLVFFHTFTGEERGLRFASKRVGKFFRDALATRQGTAQNTGTTRFTTRYPGTRREIGRASSRRCWVFSVMVCQRST